MPPRVISHLLFDLPIPPKGLHPNGRPHAREKTRLVREYRGAVCTIATSVIRNMDLAEPLLKAAVIKPGFMLPKGAKRSDPDNCIAWIKAAVDGLADAKVLANDREVVYLHPLQVGKQPRPGLQLLVISADPETLAEWERDLLEDLTGNRDLLFKIAQR